MKDITIEVQITMTGQHVDSVQVNRMGRYSGAKSYNPTLSSARRLSKALIPARTRSLRRIGERSTSIVKVFS